MESGTHPRRRGDHARRDQRVRRPGRRAGLAGLAARARRPGISGDRHARARAPHPRGGRHARRDLRRRRRRQARRWSACGRSRAWSAATSPARSPSREPEVHGDGSGPRIIALDTGIKRSIIRNFTRRGAVLELYPCTTPARRSCWPAIPTAFFLVPGPGDPAALGYVVETIRELLSTKPVFGICLGHQLLSRAAGLETFKLPFGHRGANHPVKDLRSGRIAITSPEPRLRRQGARPACGSSPSSAPPSSRT